jgi:hypothetical protein
MSNSDKSASARTRFLRNRTLAYYYDQNPNRHESGANTTFDQSAHTARVSGQYAFTIQHALKPNVVSDACCGVITTTSCTPPGDIANFQISETGNAPDPPYTNNDWQYELSWNPVPGATSYAVTLDAGHTILSLTYPTATTAVIVFTPVSNVTVTLTASTSCGNATASIDDAPCFLEGAIVQMADGTTKAIEEVLVGDLVLGAFGEINCVLALHRPVLGQAQMCRINGEHNTTNHHPHISVDKQFYCGDPALVLAGTYGREHDVLLENGVSGRMMLHGLKKERIHPLALGVDLKTVEGSRIVREMEVYSMAPDTQLYNLVVGGSHTYHVEGYAVTGWPREDDFDYDTWTPVS